ncbi:terminase TerL endonuclease subunit [Mesomycoplasma lagogenitalium]|uniref:Terminase large subunit n=1 Tax=Mesomycoplasma lagogenitalium TaxID=171286 RepID=A0ABY8LTC3_9BACT|nr:terminase TerL endonuclease subunit [Mesomycoplasma lagogenitalium]WGI36489.1 terminase large subunit [Mesomycoplasma lagogenitalium]
MTIFRSKTWENVKNFINNLKPQEIDPPTAYAIKTFNKNNISSKMVLYACARHLLFLYRQATEPDFPFIYLKEKYQAIEKFASKIIIPEINKPFIFTDFRQFISGFVFGWVYKSDKNKLITKEIFDVEARKQWKSSFWAMIALATSLGLLKDGKPEVYFCGPHKDSSKIPYNMAVNYIKKSPYLRPRFEKNNSIRIVSRKNGEIKALPFDKAGLEGKNPSLVILTEYHLHKSDEMQESALTSRNLSRPNQLIVYDTTKGNNLNSPCYFREKDYKTFLTEQILEPETIHPNYSIFLFCAELDEEDLENWKDFKLWKKANPGLDITVGLEDLKKELAAITSSVAEAEFKAKRLGIWVSSAFAYFNFDEIEASQKANKNFIENYLQNNDLKNLTGIIGVDLSSTNDTTAIVMNWEIPTDEGDNIQVFKAHFFIPENAIAKKEISDGARYREWVKNGYLTISKGKVVDYYLITDKVKEWKQLYNISALLYDPWRFFPIKEHFLKNNIFYEDEVKQVKQGVWLNPAFQLFDIKLKNKKIYILDNNQMLINHILNIETKQTNSANQTFFIKKISENSRIDGFMALLNTLSERHNYESIEQSGFFDIIK